VGLTKNCCDGKCLERELYVRGGSCVNVGQIFLPCPVHAGEPRGARGLIPPPRMLEARLRNLPAKA
jgi:hypothetical protein